MRRDVRLLTLAKQKSLHQGAAARRKLEIYVYLTEEERKVVFNEVESEALAETFKVQIKREKHDVNNQPERLS